MARGGGGFGSYYNKAARDGSKIIQQRMDRAAREARRSRTQEAPYVEVGGGETCEACKGTGECQRCEGTSWYKLRNGHSVRCRACEADRGKCRPCRGTGKDRPTRYRRDGN